MKSLFCSIVILFFLASPASFAQTSNAQQKEEDEVLAQGNPPLTPGLIDKLVEFFEWSLDSKFTKSQRTVFTAKLLQVWEKRDQSEIDGFVNMRKAYDDLAKTPKENRDKAQAHVQSVLLKALPQEPPGSVAQWLLSVYKSSHPDSGTKMGLAPGIGPVGVTSVPAELVGEWIARRGSGGSYVNPNTGQTSAADARVHSYKIFGNGTYEHSVLMQSTLYNCSITIFGRETGPIVVQGSTFTITPGPGVLDSKNSCSPSLNEHKSTDFPPETLSWRVERGEFGLQLCLQKANGDSACYLKQ